MLRLQRANFEEEVEECIAVEALEDARNAASAEEETVHMGMDSAVLLSIASSIDEDVQVVGCGNSRCMGCAYNHCTFAVAAAEGIDSDCTAVVAYPAVALPVDDDSSYRLGERSFQQVNRDAEQDRVPLRVADSRWSLRTIKEADFDFTYLMCCCPLRAKGEAFGKNLAGYGRGGRLK